MKQVFQNITILALSILFSFSTYATHNRAGEITLRQVYQSNPFYFEITIQTYTYTPSNADRPSLEVSWGDNTSSVIQRVDSVPLPDDYRRNTYVGYHTFPGAGAYTIIMTDYNRNDGVQNIPNSVSIPFTIKTTIKIDTELGANSTPILTYDPINSVLAAGIA